MISTPARSVAALVRGIKGSDAQNLKALRDDPKDTKTGGKSKKIIQGTLDGFDTNKPSVALARACQKHSIFMLEIM